MPVVPRLVVHVLAVLDVSPKIVSDVKHVPHEALIRIGQEQAQLYRLWHQGFLQNQAAIAAREPAGFPTHVRLS